MKQPSRKKKGAAAPSRLNRFHDRLVAMCIVETTAAAQSGIHSWKTEPCRLLLRVLSKPALQAGSHGG
jgi:hypothetical protein